MSIFASRVALYSSVRAIGAGAYARSHGQGNPETSLAATRVDGRAFVGQAVEGKPAPPVRVRVLADRPMLERGAYVLYWMVAQRRTHHSYALQHAAWHAQRLGKPLLVLEPLRLAYPHASDRLHHSVLDGMADTARRCAAAVLPYLA